MPFTLDDALALAYARALVAIARADGELVLDEILRIRTIVARRLGRSLDEGELFDGVPTTTDLLDAVRAAAGDPFRTAGPAPRELGRALVEDSLSLALADGRASRAELAAITALARALGCSDDDLADLRARFQF